MIDALIAGQSEKSYWFSRQVFRRAGDEHVAGLLAYLGSLPASRRNLKNDAFDVARCLEKLDFGPHRDKLFALLHHDAIEAIDVAAYLLGKQPEKLDVDVLAAHFERGGSTARRLVCYLLGRLERPDEKAAALLHRALHDKSAAVRYQAIVAVLSWHKSGIDLDALSPRLTERLFEIPRGDNLYAGSAATRLIVVLKKKEAAPDLLKLLSEDLVLRWDDRHADLFRYEITRHPLHNMNELKLLALGTEWFPRPPGEQVERVEDDRSGLFGWSDETDPNKFPLQDLPAELISALAVFDHKPAAPHLTKMLRSVEDTDQLPREERFISGFSAEALDALTVLQPELTAGLLEKVAADKSAARDARFRALDHIAASSDTALARSLLPLLAVADSAAGEESEDAPFCANVAAAVARVIERANDENKNVAELRKQAVRRIMGLLATSAGPHAVKALAKIHGDKTAERMADIALSRDWPVNTRAEALRQFGDTPDARLQDAFEKPSDDQTGEKASDIPAAQLPSTHRIRRQVNRLVLLLDDTTRLTPPEDEDERLCDVAASVLARVADLDDQFSFGFDQASRDKFVNYVRESFKPPKKD
jgi:hypothetical protein